MSYDDFAAKLVTENAVLKKQLDTAVEALKEAQKPDFFYNGDSWDVTYHEIEMLQDELDDSHKVDIMRIGRLVSLPDKFMIRLPNAQTDDTEYKEFDTKEEAQAALASISGKEGM